MQESTEKPLKTLVLAEDEVQKCNNTHLDYGKQQGVIFSFLHINAMIRCRLLCTCKPTPTRALYMRYACIIIGAMNIDIGGADLAAC